MTLNGNIIVFIVVYIIYGTIWGVATNKILENKGYDENWFIWGFIFGIVAMLVALSKPDMYSSAIYDNELLNKGRRENILLDGGWECAFCHCLNKAYVTSCRCGKSKEESERLKKEPEL